jgi:hypothetical protein
MNVHPGEASVPLQYAESSLANPDTERANSTVKKVEATITNALSKDAVRIAG